MALVMLALPGSAYVYNGEELGLPDVALPDEALQDPSGNVREHRRGRDGCRFRFRGPATPPRSVSRPPRTLVADAAGLGGTARGKATGRMPTQTSPFFHRALERRRSRCRNPSGEGIIGRISLPTRWRLSATAVGCVPACSTAAIGDRPRRRSGEVCWPVC